MKKGFTLIELLVVISIIGILAGMIAVSFTSSQRQARDVNRKSDLSQYRTSLEAFANKNNGLYPSYSSKVDPSTNICITLGLGSSCPEDPKNASDNTYYYSYITDGTGAGSTTATEYVLWAKLENAQSTSYWVVCSAGKSGISAATPTSSTCPL